VPQESDAASYLHDLNPSVRKLASSIDRIFQQLGCSSYVKTIYIGYQVGDEMVAALYGHSDHVEVALALPEDAEGDSLVDASHLTWRTLPVAAILRRPADIAAFKPLAALSVDRVRSSSHNVNRDSEFFYRAKMKRKQS
jgi:hypothetical protein